MDGSRFDALTQRLAAIRLTRQGALRGLVGSVAALTGGAAFTGGVEAGKKKPVCHCEGVTCGTLRVKKKQRKAHLRDDQCDYQGECRTSINACAAAPILIDIDLLGEPCSRNSDCGGSNSGLLCDLGLEVCVPIDLGNSCTNNGECSTGRCVDNQCAPCPEASTCGTGAGASPQCCSLLATCGVLDLCVL
jgi:hypothetical protein